LTAVLAAELRLAAEQARTMANGLSEMSAKRGFLNIAAKFDAEALAIESNDSLADTPRA